MSDAQDKLTQHQAVLARDSAMVAIDSLLEVMKEVGLFAVDVSKTLREIQMALQGSIVSDDQDPTGTTGPGENAGE